MAAAPSQSDRKDELGDVAESAAIVLCFLEVPAVPAITPTALASILGGVGLLALLVFALTGFGP